MARKVFFLILIMVASLVIIRGFFMPWAGVSASVVRASRELTSAAEEKLAGIPKFDKLLKEMKKATDTVEAMGDVRIRSVVSGYDIPKMVNQKGSKVAISLMQVLFKDTKDLDKKSLLVYSFPVSAVVCILLASTGVRHRVSVLAVPILSGPISIVGLYKLKTTSFAGLTVDIAIGNGLWYTLYGFLFIFFVSILWLISDGRAHNR